MDVAFDPDDPDESHLAIKTDDVLEAIAELQSTINNAPEVARINGHDYFEHVMTKANELKAAVKAVKSATPRQLSQVEDWQEKVSKWISNSKKDSY